MCVLDRSESQAERNPESPEAVLELEAGDLEELGRLPEIDPLGEVVADHLSLRKLLWLFCLGTGGANGEGSQEAVVEGIQKDDPFFASADYDRKLTVVDPFQDLSGPLGQLGWRKDGLRHEVASLQEYTVRQNVTRGLHLHLHLHPQFLRLLLAERAHVFPPAGASEDEKGVLGGSLLASEILWMQIIFRLPTLSSAREGLAFPGEGLNTEFPSVAFDDGSQRLSLPGLHLEMEEWRSHDSDFYELDARIDALAESQPGSFAILLLAPAKEKVRMAREVLTRCQRWADRRNEASRGALFDRVLAEHRKEHDLAKPLVRADFNHALDTWQWMLRLEPDAGFALQLAALLHDAERLISEADARVEHRAADYQAFKDEHAARGAEIAEAVLARAGVGEAERRQAAFLIEAHESPPRPGARMAEEISLLNDADALSFFSLNSGGYLDYFGPEQTRRKVAYTLGRLRPAARHLLAGIRLRPVVEAAIAEVLV